MPFHTVRSLPMSIEADNPAEAAMAAYRAFDDQTPGSIEEAMPGDEINHIALQATQRDEAIAIEFARRATVQ